MLSAANQLERIEHHLLLTGGAPLSEPVIELDDIADWDCAGRLTLALQYPSGHRLHASIAIDVMYGYPIWTNYAFHLQDRDGRCVFRYDNWPHYPAMTTFPHHKHEGEQETPREALPTLRTIVDEVQRCVEQ